MLYFIKGRAGSGKTSRLRNCITKVLTENKSSKPLLIIPEQFSFETERSMLKILGPKEIKNIDIFSFSRLAYYALKDTAYFTKKIPDSGVRSAMMSEALKNLEGRLTIFSKFKSNKSSLAPLVSLCKELKYCRIDESDLEEKSELLEEGFLKDKLKEISLINSAYNALIEQSYFDDTDAVHLLSEFASENKFFEGRTVFIDGFRAFSKQELECLNVIASQCDNAYITLCIDEAPTKLSPFYFIRTLEKQLRTIANNNSIPVKEIYCSQNKESFKSDIYSLEKNIFSEKLDCASKSDGSVVIAECANRDEECVFVAKTIKKLLREGFCRCRDIAVIERTSGAYKTQIIEELNRLSIPVFDDSKRSLVFEPLFIYASSVLSCVCNGFTTESILTMLKTGFGPLSMREIAKLEKYILVWGVEGSSWLKDFTMHPDGFGNELDHRATSAVNEINELRKKVVLPLAKLKKECSDTDGREFTEKVYTYLVTQKVGDKLYKLYEELNKDGFPVEAQRQEKSWDMLMRMLDTMAAICGERSIKPGRYYELFRILVESGEIGEIPQGLDEVTIGSADRIRTEQIKVAFLVGVNKDEFPLVSVKGGILTDSDRISLTEIGLEIRPPFEQTIDEERFIAYCAVTAASDKLYLTYKNNNDDGSACFKSEIVDAALRCINDVTYIKTQNLEPIDEIENEENAFTLLSKYFNDNSVIRSTLYKFFKDRDVYKNKLGSLEAFNNKKDIEFSNSEKSKDLFGEEMYLSASRIENFYKCPFAYFVKYGLYARELNPAKLDPSQSGTVVHYIMEKVLSKYGGNSIVDIDDDELRETIEAILKEYLNEKMGGASEKSARFMFLFNRLVDVAMAIIERLKTEFNKGSFKPCDFELDIGKTIPYYELPLNKGEVKISGSVDRVDVMEKDGIKYLRVIDYKTGPKEFKLCELFDGLNIQMVLYLMAIEKNGTDYYGETLPAGVLYLPSKIGISNYLNERKPSPEAVAKQKNAVGKLSGMVLGSPVVFNGMGVEQNPGYFPVGYNKNNEMKGNYYSIKNFNNLSKLIDDKIIDMGNLLHMGKINPLPIGKDGEGDMCSYCKFKAVCGHEFGDEIKEITNLSHLDTLERLED